MESKKAARVGLIFAAIFLFLVCLSNHEALAALLGKILKVTLPILLGLALAFILNLPLRFLERLWIRRFGKQRRGLRRGICLPLALLLMMGLISLVFVAIVPQLVRSLGGLVKKIPFYVEEINVWWEMLSNLLAARSFPFSLPKLNLTVDSLRLTVSAYLEEHGHRILNASMQIVQSAFVAVLDAIVALVISLYMLAQKEKLSGQIKKLLRGLFSEKNSARILNFGRLSEKTFANFITGQVIEAVIFGSLCFVGMLMFRMPYPLLISVIVGFTALIPIFGALIGTALGGFLILLDDPIKAIWFVIFIIVLQQIEGNLIYPKVVGNSVGLPGVWVLIAVTVGTSFGIVGMLFSVPVASVLYTLLKQFAEHRIERKRQQLPSEGDGG